MKAFLLILLAVPALVAGAVGLNQDHQDMHRHVHEVIVQRLELTGDQQAAIHKIVEAHHPALRAGAQTLVQARAELVRALLDPKTTEGQIRDLEAKGSAADLVLELEVSRLVKEIDPQLSDAQKVKVGQLLAEFHGHVAGFLAGLNAGATHAGQAAR